MHTEEELNATRALLVSNQKKYKQKFKQLVNKVARLSTKKKVQGSRQEQIILRVLLQTAVAYSKPAERTMPDNSFIF